jgi:quinol monooxygenase YgiN
VTSQQPFATITRGRFGPTHRTAGIEVLRAIVDLDADEPGTIVQAFHLDAEDSDGFWAYELWESEEALDYHRSRQHHLRARLEPLAGMPLEVYRCLPLFGKGLPFPPQE